jgi:26S proteasome regulatory subunit N9
MDVEMGDNWLESAAGKAPEELRPFYEKFRQLHSKKLWYQLTQQVEQFMANPASNAGTLRLDLYNNFIHSFSDKIGNLRLVSIAVIASKQYTDPSAALEFLTKLSSGMDNFDSQEAYVFATMEAAHFKLILGDVDGTKEAMDKCGKTLDTFNTVEKDVHASYYRVCGDFYKVSIVVLVPDKALLISLPFLQTKAEYASYYKNSLLYLACIDVEKDLQQDDRIQRARDLALSALLGDTIYNFGELLLHPILSSLDSSSHVWLSTLLFSFNAGDIGRFESLIPHLASEPILAENQPFLRQKICLMALIESVFKRASSDRTLSFETIAVETRLPRDEVEHLVMKALSLKLIKGTIDQHAQFARITWVQPRVLDKRQIEALQQRLNSWVTRVRAVTDFVKGQTREYFMMLLYCLEAC